jgi:transcription elongation factor GreB
MQGFLSQEGYDRLKAEWDQLYKQERPKLLEEIAAAAAQGDRSENAEYIYGRKKLREIDKRLRALGISLSNSRVVSDGTRRTDKIYFGAKVSLRKSDGSQMEVRIVGTDEINPTAGFISGESPLGKALMGHVPSGEIQIATPRGPQSFTIEAVSYP